MYVFNPSVVKNYRLIGFDNKRDAIADSSGELEGGDIGSGNSVLAIFEITPAISSGIQDSAVTASVAQVSLKYTLPVAKTQNVLKTTARLIIFHSIPLTKIFNLVPP